MDTRKAFEIGRLHRDQPLMIFDWNKAAQIIKERNPQSASAGLKDDWEWTGDEIFRDGKPLSRSDSGAYLASTWAIPELEIDGHVIPCFILEDVYPDDWGDEPADSFWPESALKILNSP